MAYLHRLSEPVLRLSRRDTLSLGDLMEHVLITGGSGAGKTSSSARHLREVILRCGAGACVACVKPGEAEMWAREAKALGRARSVIRLGPKGTGFNLVRWALADSPHDIEPLIHLLMQAVEFAERSSGDGDQDGKFWKRAAHTLLSNSLWALWSAHGETLALSDIQAFIDALPQHSGDWDQERWQQHSFAWHTLVKARTKPCNQLSDDDFTALIDYFRFTYTRLGDRTRASVVLTLSSVLAPLSKGPLKRIFCAERSTLVPEMTEQGAIILLDMPIKRFHEAGRLAQQLFIYCWMRAVEKRHVGSKTRPVFLYADECQFVMHSYWHEFLSTARSARAGCVMITQNLPTLIDVIGGRHPEATVDALLGHAQTVIAHANPCARTNAWFAEKIGRALQLRHSWNDGEQRGLNGGENQSVGASSSTGASWSHGQQVSASASYGSTSSYGTNAGASLGYQSGRSVNEVVDFEIQPGEIARLKRGGPRSGLKAEAFIYAGGRCFAHTGRPWHKAIFKQR